MIRSITNKAFKFVAIFYFLEKAYQNKVKRVPAGVRSHPANLNRCSKCHRDRPPTVRRREWFGSAIVIEHYDALPLKESKPVEKSTELFSRGWKGTETLLKSTFHEAEIHLDGNLIFQSIFLLRHRLNEDASEWISSQFSVLGASIIPKYIIHILLDTRALTFMGAVVLSTPSPIQPLPSSHNIFVQLTYYICLCFMSFNGEPHETLRRRLKGSLSTFCVKTPLA